MNNNVTTQNEEQAKQLKIQTVGKFLIFAYPVVALLVSILIAYKNEKNRSVKENNGIKIGNIVIFAFIYIFISALIFIGLFFINKKVDSSVVELFILLLDALMFLPKLIGNIIIAIPEALQ